MHLFLALALFAAPAPLPSILADLLAPPAVPNMSTAPRVADSCCKHCSKGQPCGDSCISRNKQCNKGSGCAC